MYVCMYVCALVVTMFIFWGLFTFADLHSYLWIGHFHRFRFLNPRLLNSEVLKESQICSYFRVQLCILVEV